MVEEKQLIYLYCVTNREPKLEQTEALHNGLYYVHREGLYAVAGKVEELEFGEEGLRRNMADFHWAKSKASAHEMIIERVMTDTDVIPFRFGTLFSTEDSLEGMLEQYGDEFKAILRRLANKQEWGLKIYCDPEKLKAGFLGGEERILKIEDEIKTSSVGKAYFLKKRKDAMLERALNERIDACSRESFELLKALSFEARINRLLPKEVTEREGDMVLNVAFLVDRDKANDFLTATDALKMHYENDGFVIDCTGPWPPYNFCGLSRIEGQNGQRNDQISKCDSFGNPGQGPG
jgi:hypothetical protein